jgi:flagellin
MSSILTNTSSMVALQTLRSINANMAQTQNEISTGKTVATAKDNAAIWSISKVMESDVRGFKGIADSLALGKSTVAVARQAAETTTDLLTQMKGRIVAAQEENVDRDAIQRDVAALRDQIRAVVGAAQFNGLNLVNGSQTSVNILASMDRDSSGNVTTNPISVAAQNLSSTGGGAVAGAFGGTTGASGDGSVASFAIDEGDSADIEFDTTNVNAGDRYVINIGDKQASYTVSQADLDDANDPNSVVAAGMRNAILALGLDGITVDLDSDTISITNETGADLNINARVAVAGDGLLSAMNGFNVATSAGATSALAEIEGMIQASITAAASFGSVQSRIETQSEFIKGLSDAMRAGIGALVDADMEETSARLQALQVQQQLGIQALSIANQQPQNILSLFR